MHSCLYGNFLFDSAKLRLDASLHSKRTSFFSTNSFEVEQQADDLEDSVLSAWSRWRGRLDKEENERCLNPLYYIFGSGDTNYEYTATSPLPMASQNFGELVKRSQAARGVENHAGSHRGLSPVSPLHSKDDMRDFYQLGLLMPETSMCSIKIWSGFFFRNIPGVRLADEQMVKVQGIKGQMVRDVRRLKDELNELELQGGSFTTDLTSFIGEVLQQQEQVERTKRKISVDASVPIRPRLSAVVYNYTALEETGQANGGSDSGGAMIPLQPLIPKARAFPERVTTLAQFTDALYSSECDEAGASKPRDRVEHSPSSPAAVHTSSPPGRSPVSRTKLRVTRTDAPEPAPQVVRWQNSVGGSGERHSPLVINQIYSRNDSGVMEEGLSDELTEL